MKFKVNKSMQIYTMSALLITKGIVSYNRLISQYMEHQPNHAKIQPRNYVLKGFIMMPRMLYFINRRVLIARF